MKKTHALSITLLFSLALAGGLLALVLLPSPEVLQSERRKPAAFPALQALQNGSWMQQVEHYLADRFPLRESFRSLRAAAVLYLLGQTDKDGYYVDSGHAGKFEALEESAARRSAQRIAALAANYPEQQVYYAVIPDKSIYARRHFPGMEPATLRKVIGPMLAELTEIDLVPALGLEHYYRTDLHWNQAGLRPVVEALGNAMGFAAFRWTFQARSMGSFHGVYAGQLALPLAPDDMIILTGGDLDGVTASYFDASALRFVQGPVYHEAAVAGRDPYDIFLGGAQALIALDNPHASTDRQLYLFRDSFGSSIAPLLVPYYSRITLIDLRYISARLLPEYVTFQPGADVLFLCGWQAFHVNTWRM